MIYPYSNGKIEAKNTHIKTLKRLSYGFKSFENMKIRIFDQSIDSSEITKNLRQKVSPSIPDFILQNSSVLIDKEPLFFKFLWISAYFSELLLLPPFIRF